MFTTFGSLAGLSLENRAEKALDDYLESVLMEATKAWVETVVHIVPTWSGQSQASIKPIADAVGVPVFTNPVPGAPNRVSEGLAQGRALYNFQKGSGRYLFFWESKVFYFIYNESRNANAVGFHLRNPGPYHSQERAGKAFQEVVRRRLRAITFDVRRHIKVNRKIFGRF